MTGDFAILSGRFESLAQPLGPGWVMRITATARDIQRIAFPFVARVAEQPVDFVCVSVRGDLFEGYLRKRPSPGDRLFVGYIKADVPTSIVYEPAIGGTLVASQSEVDIGIIGGDDRKRITPTTGLPWRWICHIEPREFSSNKAEEAGTGFLISNRHVLTAAHVVWKAFKNRQLHTVTVRPALDYNKEPFDSSIAEKFHVCPRFTGGDDQEEWDYALITLHKPLGQERIGQEHLGFWGSTEFATKFALGPVSERSFPRALTAGYPGDKGGLQLWCASGFLVNVGPNLMRTTADVTKGQSGSPVWVRVGDQQIVVGIAIAAMRANNIVGAITQGMIEELRGWIEEDGETPALSQLRTTPREQDLASASAEESAEVQSQTPAAPHAVPPPPPLPAVAGATTRTDGIDVYGPNSLPSWADMRAAGISFIIHKATEGGTIPDNQFATRYHDTRVNGFIRGAYHYYRHTDGQAGSVQADQFVAAIDRLRPGDLPPSLDFENSALVHGQHEPATASAWRTELDQFLDSVETKLGRTPLIYTSASAWQHLSGKPDYAAADFTSFRDYPLWVKSYRPRFITVTDTTKHPPVNVNVDLDNPPKPMTQVFKSAAAQAGEIRYTAQRQALDPLGANIPAPWHGNWAIWQYTPFTPLSMIGHHGFRDWMIDFDVTHGGIYFLRGLTDLGHTAPHLVGHLNMVVCADAAGVLHLFEYVNNAWVEDNRLVTAAPPAASGDPAGVSIGNEQFLIYRGRNDHVFSLTRSIMDTRNNPWTITDLGGATAIDDPSVAVLQNEVHVVYGDELNSHVHLRRSRGVWQSEHLADPTGARPVSGSAVCYIYGGALHVVSRAGTDGHLLDFSSPAGGPAPVDLTANAHGVHVPSATYRPATYGQAGQAPRIVFRALRGHIWQIDRGTFDATDLSAASGATTASGSPSCAVAGGVHILFRDTTCSISEIYDDRGVWRSRFVASNAAADPTAFLDEYGHAAVSFRAMNGRIRVARCVNDTWILEDVG
jgi:GH25 family lysozyme M1 (1,4-beta-N-acetylmuramidase)/V8-like Glu-specific endopeptidase